MVDEEKEKQEGLPELEQGEETHGWRAPLPQKLPLLRKMLVAGHENWQSGLFSIKPDQIRTSLLKSLDPDLRPENLRI